VALTISEDRSRSLEVTLAGVDAAGRRREALLTRRRAALLTDYAVGDRDAMYGYYLSHDLSRPS